MSNDASKKAGIFLMLGLLTISAFFIRLENYKNTTKRSIDEMVYFHMARQMLVDPLDYNTISYGEDLAARGRSLPQYFFQPLFKHPPLFTYFLVFCLKIFGNSIISAGYVSLFFGSLMIPLAFFIGSQIFGKKVGLLSAFFVWLDPVVIITSQKIWLDTTLAFFIGLSILLYLIGFKKGHGHIFYMGRYSQWFRSFD